MLAIVRWFFRERVELKLTPWEMILLVGLTVVPTAHYTGLVDGRYAMACYKRAAEYEAYWPADKRPNKYNFRDRVRHCGEGTL